MTEIDISIFDISAIQKQRKNKQTHRHNEHFTKSYPCDRPACQNPAYYKAPLSPQNITQHRYFCLEHIREYNKRWNYCADMTQEQILNHLEKDMIGHRPTWHTTGKAYNNDTLNSKQQKSHKAKSNFIFDDPFDFAKTIFDDINTEKEAYNHNCVGKNPDNPKSIHDACAILLITYPPEITLLKKNYKQLVKKYHPDINKNNPDAEKKIRKIIAAYKLLLEYIQQ